jgi:hypothetical protein
MSQVIFNEFELVPAPAAGAAESAEGAEPVAEENPPARSPVLEIERVVLRQQQRLRRVWAH